MTNKRSRVKYITFQEDAASEMRRWGASQKSGEGGVRKHGCAGLRIFSTGMRIGASTAQALV
jgi:hypothetical protein